MTGCLPRDRYYCLLDSQPDHLVPGRLLGQRDGYGRLIINPMCWFGWQGPPPPEMAARMAPPDAFFMTPWVVWVDDPATRAITPFWLGSDLAHLLLAKTPGQELRADEIPADLLAILWNAEVVVTPDHEAQRRQGWTKAARSYSSLFSRGYVGIDRLIHPFHVGALRRYFRYHTRHRRFQLGDGQSDRFFAHNDPVAGFFHRQLAHVLGDAIGVSIQPTYSYIALYQGGATLKPHTDREQCEYTLSWCFDATPEPDAQVPWPLHLMTADGAVTVSQHLGDGLLFRGRYLSHWRERLPDDQTASFILFHYADEGFQGSRS